MIHRHLRRSRRTLLSPKAWKVRLVFWAGAVLVGIVCALFAVLAEHANALFFRVAQHNALLPLVITPLGLVAIAWLTRRIFPGAQGSGIPQAIAALEMRRKSLVLSIRIAVGKILLTLLGLMAGASIGREGPSVHIGASIMHSLGRFARFPPHYMERGLILAGGAAGIAAAFNTPLAGIVFAIEEMSRSFEQKTSGIVTTGVVFAGITAMAILGPYYYFGASDAALVEPTAWLAVPICGVVGGLLGGLFTQGLIRGSQWVAPYARSKPLLVALLAGIAVAIIGYASGYSASGTGYQEAKAIITGEAELDLLYPLYKMAATLASYLSGIPGGIFAPSLATGAGVGADLGHLLPVAPLSVMVLLGMVGYFSGVVQSPLTAFVIVMEMTANQNMLLALMATSFIAYGTSLQVCPRPLYRTLAEAFLSQDKGR
jgi:H+/Cl- antiporter ClcA